MTFTILFLSELYGLVTVEQDEDGKHLYRALEAHFSLSIPRQNVCWHVY